MRGLSEGGARHRRASALRWAESLFVIGGVAMLAWCVMVLTDAYISQRTARQSLEAISHVAAPGLPLAAASTAVPKPPLRRGAAIAALSIPRVDLSAVVLHGSDEQTLRRGPGHLESTAMPGEGGNAVIAGHRDSFFRGLRHVRIGDDIFVDTPHGRFRYRAKSLRVVHSRDLSVLEPTEDDVLTLITCYPFWLLGSAPDRFVVRATRVADTAAAAPVASTTPSVEAIGESYLQGGTNAAQDEASAVRNRTAPDDETLVRQAIERFRLTYNARLISRNDHRPGGPLKFPTCEVIIDGDRATARCGTAADWGEDGVPDVWTSTLERAGAGWAIKQIRSAD